MSKFVVLSNILKKQTENILVKKYFLFFKERWGKEQNRLPENKHSEVKCLPLRNVRIGNLVMEKFLPNVVYLDPISIFSPLLLKKEDACGEVG